MLEKKRRCSIRLLYIRKTKCTIDSCGGIEIPAENRTYTNGSVSVNFGDEPAPDLAINAINLLADRAKEESPEASRMLKEHTYVDDIAGSGSKLDEVREVTNSINAILNKGKFSMKA